MRTTPIKRKLQEVLSFPNPVNEYAARVVAAMVALLVTVILVFDLPWLTVVLAYGFLARVLAGPKLSPMGLLATRVVAPLFNLNKPVAGPPKQFAQTIGLVFASASLLLHYLLGFVGVAKAVLGILLAFAILESFLGFCAGCLVFGYLMRWGLIPKETCAKCNDLRFADR